MGMGVFGHSPSDKPPGQNDRGQYPPGQRQKPPSPKKTQVIQLTCYLRFPVLTVYA